MLCALALLAVAVPAVGYVGALNGKVIRLTDQPQHLVLPADKTYGIYVEDANNSRYSERCSAIDTQRHQIRMTGPPWSVSSSDTETLDLVYNTGSGRLTIDCAVPGEQVTTRPAPNNREMLLGVVLASVLGCAGVAVVIGSLIGRSSRRTSHPPEGAARQGA